MPTSSTRSANIPLRMAAGIGQNQLALGLYITEIKVQKEESPSQIKDRLQRVHGDRVKGVVSVSSAARRNLSDDSDVHLLVPLQSPVHFAPGLQTNTNALYLLVLENGHPISAKSVDAKRYDELALYEWQGAIGSLLIS